MTRRRRDERGAMAVLVAVCLIVLLPLVGLVVDLGLARDVDTQSQNAADASALAAGNVLYVGNSFVADVPGAVAAAQAYAAANLGTTGEEWSACTDTGRLPHTTTASECISFDDPVAPTVVRVRVPTREVDTPFGGLAGVTSVSVSAMAQVELLPGRTYSCALCVLGAGPHAIGNGDVVVGGSGVHLNGSVDTQSQGRVTADGEITVEGTASGQFTPSVQTQAGRIEDPLASMVLPPSGTSSLVPRSDPCQGGPGVYGAHKFSSACTLTPGIYVVTGRWELTNTADLRGDGVTLYATCGTTASTRECGTGEVGGQLDAKNGNLRLTGGAVPGFAVIYDRNNVSGVAIQGNGVTEVAGTIYARSAKFYANGTTARNFTNASIVVDSIDFNGNIKLNMANGLGRTWQRPPGGLHLER